MNYEETKAAIIAALREYIDKDRDDVETGIDEGIYDKEDNVDKIAWMTRLETLCDEFEKMKPYE